MVARAHDLPDARSDFLELCGLPAQEKGFAMCSNSETDEQIGFAAASLAAKKQFIGRAIKRHLLRPR
jgi:hypothetical protein